MKAKVYHGRIFTLSNNRPLLKLKHQEVFNLSISAGASLENNHHDIHPLHCYLSCTRFSIKITLKKEDKNFLKRCFIRTYTRAHIVQCLFLCYQPFMFFHLLISHTKHPPSTPSHDCDAFMLWVGKYVVSEHINRVEFCL